MSEKRCSNCDEPVNDDGLTTGDCAAGRSDCDECGSCLCDGSC